MINNDLCSVIRCAMRSDLESVGSGPSIEVARGTQTGGEGVATPAGGGVCSNPVTPERNLPQSALLPEPLVARVIGIKKHRLVTTRKQHLAKTTDWLPERNVVCYTPSGLKKLLGVLGLSEAAFTWPAAGECSGTWADDEAAPEAPGGAGGAVLSVLLALPAPGTTARDYAASRIEELTVRRIFGNPSLLEATRANGEAVRVRVQSNAKFITGMKLKARAPSDGPQLWYLVGHCPRWKGRY